MCCYDLDGHNLQLGSTGGGLRAIPASRTKALYSNVGGTGHWPRALEDE
jgi:hypothetical protein